MSNVLFSAVSKEKDPMYDAAVITEDGTEYWHDPQCNFANNGHSVTKFFISSAVGVLVSEGKLKLDDKVTNFFTKEETGDKIDTGWKNVTVEHALQHKTGMLHIPYGVDEDEHVALIGDDFLKYVFSVKIEAEPGVQYKYTDADYYLLGRIIHKASGMTAYEFIREKIAKPLGFRQWGMLLCPMGHTIGGGGLYTRSDDTAKLGFLWANQGKLGTKEIISPEYIKAAMENDYASTSFRGTDIYLKTGAKGQCVAYSIKRKAAAAWHGYSQNDGNARNDRLLEAFEKYLNEKFGEIKEN
ncbi:MAG: serine hydrolase [Clostridia bacterium]|nr:serine hydrolase [Clostridia bacterium]